LYPGIFIQRIKATVLAAKINGTFINRGRRINSGSCLNPPENRVLRETIETKEKRNEKKNGRFHPFRD
jgi:Uri superfamily endonuclease